jgi:hypothetical protein
MKYKSKEAFLEDIYDYYLIELEDMTVTEDGDEIHYDGLLNFDDEDTQWLATFNTKTLEGIMLPPEFGDDEDDE